MKNSYRHLQLRFLNACSRKPLRFHQHPQEEHRVELQVFDSSQFLFCFIYISSISHLIFFVKRYETFFQNILYPILLNYAPSIL